MITPFLTYKKKFKKIQALIPLYFGIMAWFLVFVVYFGSIHANVLLKLKEDLKVNKEICLNSIEHSDGQAERELLSVYDYFPLRPFPLLVTTTVLEDGFGDYIQLKNILELLREFGFKDVEVLIYYPPQHKSKIALHPLPKNFSYHFVEYSRKEDHCSLFDGEKALNVKTNDFCSSIISHPLFEDYRQGKRELLVVAAFFSEAFGKLKMAQGRHVLFLRENTPYLRNALLQNLFVLGWGVNQAMFVDKKFLLIKSLTDEEKNLLALKTFPNRLLKTMCAKEISEDALKQYFVTHTVHHAYFHQKDSNLAFIEIILHSLATSLKKHDFYLKNLAPLYQHLADQNIFSSHVETIEFHFMDGTKKIILGNGNRIFRFIETEFLSSTAYALLISLISPPYIEGCTGDNSPQQAILFEHIPLIEHTKSKDFINKDSIEKHYCQNSICLYQSLAQLTPYPDHLAKILYISDLLMLTIRQNPNGKEKHLLTKVLASSLKKEFPANEIQRLFNFITKERNLKFPLRQLLKRQGLLAKHPQLQELEERILYQLQKASPLEADAVLKNFASGLTLRK